MKSFIFSIHLFLVLGTAILVLGCAQPDSHSAGVDIPADKGLLRVNLNLSSKTLLDGSQSKSLANSYEVLVVSSTALATAKLALDSPATFALSPGSYKIIVLAGVRRSDAANTALLVGSGVSDAVIVQGIKTDLNVTLTPVDISMSCADSVETGAGFNLVCQGKSGNSYIGMSLSGATTERPRVKSTTIWDGYKDFTDIQGTPDNWSCTLAAVAPKTEGTIDLQFNGAVLTLLNSGTQTGSLAGRTLFSWKWLGRYDLADDSPLVSVVLKNVNVAAPATGLGISVSWN